MTDKALSEEACDLALMGRYARTSWRWVDAYHKGLDGVLACWAVRKSKCHRFVTPAVDAAVNQRAEAQAEGEAARAAFLGGVANMAAVGALCDDDDS